MSEHPNLRVISSLDEITLGDILGWYPYLANKVESND
jgi:hypothetical protein